LQLSLTPGAPPSRGNQGASHPRRFSRVTRIRKEQAASELRVNPGFIGPWGKTEKWCPGCQRMLPFSAFRQQFTTSTWLSSWCRGCSSAATRAWREQNRERINAARRTPPVKLRCVECGGEFEGRKGKLICSRRCKDRRYARLHPEELREKQRRKYARRKAA
jgi:hypothetical protein